MKEMVGGCCVCSDDRGWAENPLVYCDGQGCTVAVHQACYGIVTVPIGNWYCRKCESQERSTKVRCELCPNREGALKPTDNSGWAHVVCALYIPEVRFGNVTTMEPIILAQIPQERFNKTCYICEESRRSRANVGACMQCNKSGCRQQFHVTCAQALGLLCEEASNYMENVKYCGYCHHHYNKIRKGANVKVIPPYRPIGASDSPDASPTKDSETSKAVSKRKLSTSSSKGTKSGVAAMGEGTATVEILDEESTSQPETVKLGSNKRRKGGSRTPPTAQASPETSPRPPAAPSPSGGGTVVLNSGPTPIRVPSDQQPPRPLSATATATAASPSLGGGSQNSSSQQKEGGGGGVGVVGSRPNSIVVTVPLEVLPSTVPPVPSPPVGLPQPQQPASSQDQAPAKRQRSQSSDKSEKGRRWMKRGSGGNKTPQSPPPQSSGGSKPPTTTTSPPIDNSSCSSGGSGVVGIGAAVLPSGGDSKPRRLGSNSNTPDISQTTSSQTVLVKEEKDVKLFQNGLNAPHMLGNQLNPSSTMAQKMCDTLSQEMVAHSVFSQESATSGGLVGPQLHRASSHQNRSNSWTGTGSAPTTNNHTTPTNNNVPQSLEQLLERQWEQGSQFLMEQAQHFDIASLLSCLHQLRAENAQLEEHVSSLAQRRDHLLAVNARLAIPLVQQQPPVLPSQTMNNVGSGTPPVSSSGGGGPPILENGIASPAEQQVSYQRNNPPGQHTPRASPAGGQVFAGGGGGQQNSVVVRAAPGDQRRNSSTTGGTYNNHGNPSMYNSGQQSQNQTSQVVMRRDVISELHHGLGGGVPPGSGGGKQP